MTMGVMRTTATNAAEVHTHLMPFTLLICKLCLQATLCYATLPDTHPLAKVARSASLIQVKQHRAPLHMLFEMHQIHPTLMEKQWVAHKLTESELAFITMIPERHEVKNIRAPRASKVHIYTDGSGIEGRVGAAATM